MPEPSDFDVTTRALLLGWSDQGPAGVLKRSEPAAFLPLTKEQTVTLAVNAGDVEQVERALHGRWDLPAIRIVPLSAVPAGQMWAWAGTLSDTNRPAVYALPEPGAVML